MDEVVARLRYGGPVEFFYLEFQKAFPPVKRRLFLTKLIRKNVDRMDTDWIRGHTNHSLCVGVDDLGAP